MKTISKHIRLTETGIFELVTWIKDKEGKKHLQIELTKPTPAQAIEIAASRYQEIILPIN